MKTSDHRLWRNLPNSAGSLRATSLDFASDIDKQPGLLFRQVSRWSPVNVIVFLALLIGTTILRFAPVYFDYPAARAINNIATGHELANELAAGVVYPTLEGVILLSLVWYCWFSGISSDLQARLMRGVIAAVVAGLVAGLWQHVLPSTPKPIFDTTLHIQAPGVLGDIDVLRATSSPSSPSFPSQRGTMFAGMAIAVFMVRRWVGLLALGWTVEVEGCRVYLGLHYPTDIIGSFCLAAAIVWLAEADGGLGLGTRFVRWERASASTFYMCAFFASYHIATAFQDLRDLTAGLLH